jgi:hypothetical protein
VYVGRNLRRHKNGNYWTEKWVTEEQQQSQREKQKLLRGSHLGNSYAQIQKQLRTLAENEAIEIATSNDWKIWRRSVRRFNDNENNKQKIAWFLKKLPN